MTRTTTLWATLLLLAATGGCDEGAGEGETTATEQTGTGGQEAEPAPEPAPAEEPEQPATDAPTVEHTPAEGVHGEEVTYTANGTTLRGYLAYQEDQQGERPGVLVVHEWWGHNAYARKRADALAKMGYTALAVDMYGGGKQAEHPEDAKKFSSKVMKNLETAKARFVAAKELLAEHETTDPEKMAAIGYCFGGGVVLHMARAGVDLDVVASFHGMLGTDDPAKEGDIEVGKILVYHGAADPFVTDEQIEAFKKEMKEAGADFEFVAYEGAKHAFTNPEATELGERFDLPLAYDEEADDKSWEHFSKQLEAAFGEG